MNHYRGKSPNRARTPNPAEGTGVGNVFKPLPPKNSKEGMELKKRNIRAYSIELAQPVQQNLQQRSSFAPRSPAYSTTYPDMNSPTPDYGGHPQKTYKFNEITPTPSPSSWGRTRISLQKPPTHNTDVPSIRVGARTKTSTKQYTPDRQSNFGLYSTGKLRGMTPVEYEPPKKKGRGRPTGSTNKAHSVSNEREPPKNSRALSAASNVGYKSRESSRQPVESPKRRGSYASHSNNTISYNLEDYEKCVIRVDEHWKLLDAKLVAIKDIKHVLQSKINDFKAIMQDNYY